MSSPERCLSLPITALRQVRAPIMTINAPATKAARHAKIISLLSTQQVRSQTELADLLATDGIQVNQGTLSRDLVEVGAVRVRGRDGHLIYAVPAEGGDRTP